MALKWAQLWLGLILLLWACAAAQAEIVSIMKNKEGAYHHVSACNDQHKKGPYNATGDRSTKTLMDDYSYKSVLGDGGMREERVRVALESWNFCNRVGSEGGLDMPSPRHADCAHIVCSSSRPFHPHQDESASCKAEHLVKVADNELKSGQAFPQQGFIDYTEPDDYAIQKELYLASLCETKSDFGPWHFWMIMLKNGNFDVKSGMCPSTAPSASRPFTSLQPKAMMRSVVKGSLPHKVAQMAQTSTGIAQESQEIDNKTSADAAKEAIQPSLVHLSHISTNAINGSQIHQQIPPPPLTASKGSFPCFGPGCMNHPKIFHNWSTIQELACGDSSDPACEFEYAAPSLSGSFYGTYDLDDTLIANESISPNSSYFQVDWNKDPQSGTWLFHHVLKVNHKYPWLMLYLRADATQGFSGGYPWETRGMMIQVPESPNFKVQLTLEVLQGGGFASQFYLLDIGGCWKNDGSKCDGNTSTDVTRYSEMIINPSTDSWCKPSALSLCPPYHVHSKTKQRIYRNDTANFPYAAYHYYCVPPNARYAEKPYSVCDPYSNPQPQELMQLMPHPEWAVHGYPSTKGQGWIGDPRTWTLDVGGLSERLYFYQDPDTEPAPRKWTSVDVGTEIYISQRPETAEWIVSDFDVLSTDPHQA